MTGPRAVPKKRKSLGECTVDLEILCREADEKDGVLSDAEIARLDEAKMAHADRVDSWIGYLDAAKALIVAIEDRKARADKALKAAKTVQERLKSYLKFLVEQHPSLPWKGAEGTIALQKNPKRLWLLYGGGETETIFQGLSIKSYSVPNVVPGEVVELEPSMKPYLRQVTLTVLDKDLVKADLESGMQLPWARFEQGTHCRVK